jgi:hypothetical protein
MNQCAKRVCAGMLASPISTTDQARTAVSARPGPACVTGHKPLSTDCSIVSSAAVRRIRALRGGLSTVTVTAGSHSVPAGTGTGPPISGNPGGFLSLRPWYGVFAPAAASRFQGAFGFGHRRARVNGVMDHNCLCTHDRGGHAHYRSGSDCAVCPPGTCYRFRAATPLRLRLDMLLHGSARGDVAGQHSSEGNQHLQPA